MLLSGLGLAALFSVHFTYLNSSGLFVFDGCTGTVCVHNKYMDVKQARGRGGKSSKECLDQSYGGDENVLKLI